MYFVDLFSLAAILGLGFGRPPGGIWLAGFAAAALAIFTMASGFLAAMALIGLVILRLLKQRRFTRGQILTLLGSAVVVALGLALKVEVARHQVYQAQSFPVFLAALWGGLAFPFYHHPAMAVVMLLPLLLLLVKYFQPGFQNLRVAEFVLTFGLWGFLQAAALAFGRAPLLTESSRYLDSLCTLPMAGVAALFVLAMDFNFYKLPKKVALAGAVLWLVLVTGGLVSATHEVAEKYLQLSRTWELLEAENVRAFMATDDAGWLKSDMHLAIPYWNSDVLIDLLRQPKIRSIMPVDARPALKLEPAAAAATGFYANGCPPDRPAQPFVRAWGNFSTNGTLSAGKFMSQPMQAGLPKLSIQLYGGATTKIRLAGADNQPVELHPAGTGYWETFVVDAPAGPFTISIENAAADTPVAIGDIRELGRFSVFAQGLIKHAVLILSIGLCLCLVFAVTGLTRPGISLANEGLAWLLVLVVTLTALVGTYCWRGFDSVENSFALHKKWAVAFASIGQPGRAGLHLREALWLRPDDVETKKELGLLKQRGLDEPLPEKAP